MAADVGRSVAPDLTCSCGAELRIGSTGLAARQAECEAFHEAHRVCREASLLRGMPDDLVRALRDPSITIANEHSIKLADGRTLWEHLREWREAPSNTASAGEPDA